MLVFCRTFKMSRDYGWRASCPAGGVTDVVVGSSAWFGSVFFSCGLGVLNAARVTVTGSKIVSATTENGISTQVDAPFSTERFVPE